MVRKLSENNKAIRCKLLQKELKPYQGRQFYCKALDCFVRVTSHSISETAHHASRSVVSTKLALRLPYIIENAKILQPNVPTKQGQKQTKVMKFQYLILLTCGIRGLGTALLTVGKRISGNVYEYCITDFRLHQTTEKESSVVRERTRPSAFYCRRSRQTDVRTYLHGLTTTPSPPTKVQQKFEITMKLKQPICKKQEKIGCHRTSQRVSV